MAKLTIEKIQERKGKVLAELNHLTFSEDAANAAYTKAVDANDAEAQERAREWIARNGKERRKLLEKYSRYDKMLRV